MSEGNKRDSNESTGSFQRALDQLVVMKPIFDPMLEIKQSRAQGGASSSVSKSQRQQPCRTCTLQPIPVKELREASKTMNLHEAAKRFKTTKKAILHYCKVFRITWNSELTGVTTKNGKVITKQMLTKMQRKYLQHEAASHLGISESQLQRIRKKLGIMQWRDSDYKKKILEKLKHIPSLVEMLQMEREMGARQARLYLNLTETEFERFCQDVGMDHRWNHRIAKKFPRPPSAPTSP
jgi:hypothetical protein